MAQPTLVQVFGANATQTSTTLTISKSDLEAVGLTVSSTNEAEKLLAAIIKLAATNLSTDYRDGNTDASITANPNQNIAISLSDLPSFVTRDDGTGTFTPFIRDTYSIQLDKAYSATTIDPDDY